MDTRPAGTPSRKSSTAISGDVSVSPADPGPTDREASDNEGLQKGLDAYQVRFGPNDPENPQNWSRFSRWNLTALAGLLVLNA